LCKQLIRTEFSAEKTESQRGKQVMTENSKKGGGGQIDKTLKKGRVVQNKHLGNKSGWVLGQGSDQKTRKKI